MIRCIKSRRRRTESAFNAQRARLLSARSRGICGIGRRFGMPYCGTWHDKLQPCPGGCSIPKYVRKMLHNARAGEGGLHTRGSPVPRGSCGAFVCIIYGVARGCQCECVCACRVPRIVVQFFMPFFLPIRLAYVFFKPLSDLDEICLSQAARHEVRGTRLMYAGITVAQ